MNFFVETDFYTPPPPLSLSPSCFMMDLKNAELGDSGQTKTFFYVYYPLAELIGDGSGAMRSASYSHRRYKCTGSTGIEIFSFRN